MGNLPFGFFIDGPNYMARADRTLQRVLSGALDRNIRFADLCHLLRDLGFDERVRGSHHIFTRDGVEDILNLQPLSDGRAKPYQVRQSRQVIVKYGLAEEDNR